MFNRKSRLVIWLGVALLMACSGDDPTPGADASVIEHVDASGGNHEDGSGGGPLAVEVLAAEGGVVVGEGMSLSIPAGALAADTTITLEVEAAAGMPDEGNIASDVFNLGPNGLVFLAPATLELPYDGSPAPEGMRLTMAYLDGSAWVPLISTSSGDKVTASISHFTAFAVIHTPDQGQDLTCETFDFSPCGGDISGAWEFGLGCLEGQALPLPCEEASMDMVVDMGGSVSFVEDGTYNVQMDTTVTMTLNVPYSCLEGVTCADAGEGWTDTGEACVNVTTDSDVSEDLGTWSAEGSTITTVDEEGDMETMDYCVEGNSLKVRRVDDGGFTYYYQATKP